MVSPDPDSVSRIRQLGLRPEDFEESFSRSGGPGGQHANRSLTRVIATFRVDDSGVLGDAEKLRLNESLGPVVRSSASRFRSQTQNRRAALDQLAEKLATALAPRTPRRATKPTRSAVERRVDEKKLRGRLKVQRRRPIEE